MPIRLAEPPAAAAQAVRETLARRAEQSDFGTRALRAAPAEELAVAAPHPVYTLGLRALADGEGLGSAELLGWRYLVQRRETAIASVEVHAGTGAVEVNEGPFVRATEDAIRKAEQRPELGRAMYELRLLRIPAVYLVALWMKVDGEGDDVVMPIGESPPEVESDRAYGGAELLAALREPARRQLEFDSSPGSQPQRD